MRAIVTVKCDVPNDMQDGKGINMDRMKFYIEEALRKSDFAYPTVDRITLANQINKKENTTHAKNR